jgi:hypothetical protein
VRRAIYITNVIESVHMQLRKIIKTRGHFLNGDAAIKLIWLALRNIMMLSTISSRVKACDEPVRGDVQRSLRQPDELDANRLEHRKSDTSDADDRGGCLYVASSIVYLLRC